MNAFIILKYKLCLEYKKKNLNEKVKLSYMPKYKAFFSPAKLKEKESLDIQMTTKSLMLEGSIIICFGQ